MGYQQLTQEDRYHIYGLRQGGLNQSEIADRLGVHKATISREITRNKGLKGYRPQQAQKKYEERIKSAEKAIRLTPEVHDLVVIGLEEQWSPEQISGWLKKEWKIDLSHQRIYQFVWEDKTEGGELHKNLRQNNKKRRARYGRKSSTRGHIKNRTPISERPPEVDSKQRLGDWEGDTITSRQSKGALVTLVERKSKTTLIRQIPEKSAHATEKAIVEMLAPYKNHRHTLTLDNGKEFASHDKLTEKLGIDVYFADPYSSWQRGVNENTNGLIRQYLPKKTDFAKVDADEVFLIQEKLNNRPRRTLDFETPNAILELKYNLNDVALVS